MLRLVLTLFFIVLWLDVAFSKGMFYFEVFHVSLRQASDEDIVVHPELVNLVGGLGPVVRLHCFFHLV